MDIAQIITGIGTILGIAAVMVLRDLRDGKPLFRKPHSSEIADPLTSLAAFMKEKVQEISTSQSQLQHHYNDETTAILTSIQITLSDIKECVGIMNRGIDKVSNKLDEFEKYGVKNR